LLTNLRGVRTEHRRKMEGGVKVMYTMHEGGDEVVGVHFVLLL